MPGFNALAADATPVINLPPLTGTPAPQLRRLLQHPTPTVLDLRPPAGRRWMHQHRTAPARFLQRERAASSN
jgi:hypothetical protein